MSNTTKYKKALEDYIEVNVRIEKFWKEHPNGRIQTEIIKWENDTVVVKATVWKNKEDEKPDATGHAYEKEGQGYINKTSALENCETSAVGRALAILGYEIKKSIASKEEVENAKAIQNKIAALNKKRRTEIKAIVGNDKKLVQLVIDTLKKFGKKHGKKKKELEDLTKEEYAELKDILKKAKEGSKTA